MAQISLIMLAAGDSTRFGAECKKQWLRVGDEPLWLYATKNIAANFAFKDVIVASNDASYMAEFSDSIKFAPGGATRQESLKNALKLARGEFVMVSDVARACVPASLVARLIAGAQNADCVVPVLKVADTATLGQDYVDRNELRLIQTPQISRKDLLEKALQTSEIFTDDSGAMKALGAQIWYVGGDEKAKKITYKDDLKGLDLPPPSADFFVGQGFDVHKFSDQKAEFIKICGVKVPYNRALLAHSDGDVGLHALCDALFGAAGLGDIGEFYPDNDPKFSGANSLDLLKDCAKIVRSLGFDIVNIDITLMAQEPKFSPLKAQMRREIAQALNLKATKINVKATTTEKLGFLGRKEGVAASAVVSLKYFDWRNL